MRTYTSIGACLLLLPLLGCSPRDDQAATESANTAGATAAPAPAQATDAGQDASMAADAAAQAPSPGVADAMVTTPQANAASATDATSFYRTALASGTGEADLARYALTHAQASGVRDFAGTLASDHDALNTKLRAASGLPTPTPDPADKAAAEAVKAMQGEAFDRAFLDHMAMGHAKSIALYQGAADGAGEATARALARDALPQLRSHAAMVAQLQQAMR